MPEMSKDKKNYNSASHKPPSRVKYEQSHPTVSFRIERQHYDQLMKLLSKSGQSIADFFKEALSLQQSNTDLVYEQGYEKGFGDAKEQYSVTFPCCICQETAEVNTNEIKLLVAEFLTKFGVGHEPCVETPGQEVSAEQIGSLFQRFQLLAALRPEFSYRRINRDDSRDGRR